MHRPTMTASAARAANATGIVALLAVGLAGSCAPYTDPGLTVVAATPTEESAAGLVIEFTIDASNDNDVALPLREVEYALDLDGRRVFEGIRSPEATLRAGGVQQLRLPAAIPFSGTGLGGVRPTGTARYRLTGTITYITPGALAETLFDTGVRRPTVDFQQEGTVDLGTGTPSPAAP